KELFEVYFLSSERRRKKYELTRELATYLSESYVLKSDRPTPRTHQIGHLLVDASEVPVRRMVWTMLVVILFSIIGYVLISKRPSDLLTNTPPNQVKEGVDNQSTGHQTTSVDSSTVPPLTKQPELRDLHSKADVPDLIKNSQPYGSAQTAQNKPQAATIPTFI